MVLKIELLKELIKTGGNAHLIIGGQECLLLPLKTIYLKAEFIRMYQ